jgi:murein DD-endopeptidase MepM/ murein hydrolase activator NlpD
MSSLSRRAGAVAAAVAAMLGLVLAAPRADATVPETVSLDAVAQAEARALARQVRERQQSLNGLNRRADARERAILGRKALLAKYGYTGDPDAVRTVLPLASYHLSAGFGLTGPMWEAQHGGQDFGASPGEQIVAIASGTVTDVAYAGPYGLRTIVTLPDGTEIWYCHQTDASVSVGEHVEVADRVGSVGSTGNSTGPHLHLEVRPGGGLPVDPMDWLRADGLNP